MSMVNGRKQQRIRDPIHDLIEFGADTRNVQLEGALWQVLQTRPFQRLRRVKQLGFSDLVYPGATHSRFAHSVGVFHTSRMLMEIVRKHLNYVQDTRENHALAAALLHDLGHGPFSHAFENVGKRLGLKLANHETLSEELIRSGEIADVLDKGMENGFAGNVADILKKDGVKTVHHAVVSSQFDADRLDYIRRDRFMAGSQHAGIDFGWLLANLQIKEVSRGVDDTALSPIETFVIGPKAIHAAEAYVLGLFQLYPTVYFHKTTRGIEKLFEELLVRIVDLVRQGQIGDTGLDGRHPLIRFAQKSDDMESALLLDDAVVWGALPLMHEAEDVLISQFSRRLRDRDLFKCVDVRAKISHELDPKCTESDEKIEAIDKCCALVKDKLTIGMTNAADGMFPRVLIDEAERPPYKSIDKTKGPLDRIMVSTDGNELVDLRERSSVVRGLKLFKLLRVYVDRNDADALTLIENTIQEEKQKCLGS
jgi:uncharacterized protein